MFIDSGNGSSKTNNKSYLNVGVPGNKKKLQTRNLQAISETLNSHKIRLN